MRQSMYCVPSTMLTTVKKTLTKNDPDTKAIIMNLV